MGEDEIIDVPFDEEEIDSSTEIFRTYRMDFKNKRIVGMVDGYDAAIQSIWKAFMTKRFAYQIYDDQYGCDILNKVGNIDLTPEYFDTDIPAMIEDMLSVEDMVAGIDSIDYMIYDKDSVSVTCVCQTIFGEANIQGVIVNE